MNDFIFYFKLGLNHVLDLQAYDHVLFLMVLVAAYSLKQWKELLWLVTAFTLGHTLTLALSTYKLISVNAAIVEFLIPATIVFTAVLNLFSAGKTSGMSKLILFLSFCFGWIHGLGFSNYFKMLIAGSDTKLLQLIEFSLGIEAAQLVIVVIITALFLLLHTIFKVSKRDWVLVLSSIVIGIAIPMLVERYEDFIRQLL